MTFGSLFSGIGGMDLGLERAGMTCRWQVEIDDFCRRVLTKHWPEVPKYGDIRELTGAELGPVDLIAGGFPCQDLSQAGKRTGIEGSRSGLWFEYARLIGELGPRYVLIENVAGLLVHNAMRRVVGELARLGYVGCWRSLRASDFGASHLRKRVFVVAYREHEGRILGRTAHDDDGRYAPRNDADGRDQDVADARFGGAGRAQEPSRLNRTRPSGYDSRASGTLEDTARDEQPGLQGQGGWLRRRGVCEAGEPLADPMWPFAPGPSDPRWHAILEARPDLAPALESPLRGVADGLPDWLERAMSDRTKRLSRLGNAVVPQVAEWIGRRIIEADRMRTA